MPHKPALGGISRLAGLRGAKGHAEGWAGAQPTLSQAEEFLERQGPAFPSKSTRRVP